MSTRYTSIDHGEVLAHDMTGAPLHYVHEISIRCDAPESSTRVLARQGFRYNRGWRDDEKVAWDCYSRVIPVSDREKTTL